MSGLKQGRVSKIQEIWGSPWGSSLVSATVYGCCGLTLEPTWIMLRNAGVMVLQEHVDLLSSPFRRVPKIKDLDVQHQKLGHAQ
jgi:hypothetical protein